jgi:hypothetical protein
MKTIPPKDQADAQAQETLHYRDRDKWITDVLSDLELSPTARMVGARLGLAVDFDCWPCIEMSAIGGHLGELAAQLGLPLPIVAKACNALVRRGWLQIWMGCDGQRGLELHDISSLRKGGRS